MKEVAGGKKRITRVANGDQTYRLDLACSNIVVAGLLILHFLCAQETLKKQHITKTKNGHETSLPFKRYFLF